MKNILIPKAMYKTNKTFLQSKFFYVRDAVLYIEEKSGLLDFGVLK